MATEEAKKAAEEAKALGNTAYKAKKFAEAHGHYDKAIELDPANISYLTNKAAVFLEEGKYDDCVALCEKAVEVGRSAGADFKQIARAFERAGKAKHRLGQLEEALRYLDKSLSEHRDQALVQYRHKVDAEHKDALRRAKLDPEKAAAKKEEGNSAFKEGRFADAKKAYDAAIECNPDDAKLYSNRAAALSKLMAFQDAVRDCNTAIKLDPNFVKAYLRKANCHAGMQEYSQATRAYEEALRVEPQNEEAQNGLRRMMMENQGNPEEAKKRALENPEVQDILRDPAMRTILEQAQSDPKALQEHLKDPMVAEKFAKLLDAGVIGIR